MSDTIEIAKVIKIPPKREGKGEDWLKEEIRKNPSIIGLERPRDLKFVDREVYTSPATSKKRLDMLLLDQYNNTMYELEVQLEDTDEEHIIHTIEYWNDMRRRRSGMRHIAVLMAEKINNRFFNIVHLFGHYIPIIAIQVNIIEVNGVQALSFNKILDTSEEIIEKEEEIDGVEYDRAYWEEKANWTLETADCLKELLSGTIEGLYLEYKQQYIWLSGTNGRYIKILKKGQNKTLLIILMEKEISEETKKLLHESGIKYTEPTDRRASDVEIIIDNKSFVEEHKDVFIKIAELLRES